MLEVLCRRKRIRNFLNLYSPDKWTEVIPYVVEIAILNLKNSFGTLLFDKDEFKNILHNLKSPNRTERTMNKTNYYKPSTEWRNGTATNAFYQLDDNYNKYYHQPRSKSKPKSKGKTYYNTMPNNQYQRFNYSSTLNNKYKNITSKIKEQVNVDKQLYYEKTGKNQKKFKKIENAPPENNEKEEFQNQIKNQFKSKTLQNYYNENSNPEQDKKALEEEKKSLEEEKNKTPKINSPSLSNFENTNAINTETNEVEVPQSVERNENELTFKNNTVKGSQISNNMNQNENNPNEIQNDDQFHLSNISISDKTKQIFQNTMKK